MSAQQDVLRGSRLEYEETLGYALRKGPRVRRAHAHARRLLPHHRRGPSVKGAAPIFGFKKRGLHPLPRRCLVLSAVRIAADPRAVHRRLRITRHRPTARRALERSHVQLRRPHHRRCHACLQRQQALHVFTPRGAKYRRGYVAIHLKTPVPRCHVRHVRPRDGLARCGADRMPGAPPVHWTLLQGEGRSADDRYNSIYRLGWKGRAARSSWPTSKPRRRSLPIASKIRHSRCR